jgi:carbonic anhydrase
LTAVPSDGQNVMNAEHEQPADADAVAVQASGFKLERPAGPDSDTIGTVIARNRGFAAAGGHQGAVPFPTLRLFVLTCIDPRTDPAHFLGLQLSDAVVARNVGGRVTPEVINDVAFIAQIAENAIPEGPLFEVAVIHHNQCGSGALADDSFRHNYGDRTGVAESTLRDRAVIDPVTTVETDVLRLRSALAIPARVAISGHVYDVTTGLIRTIVRSDR